MTYILNIEPAMKIVRIHFKNNGKTLVCNEAQGYSHAERLHVLSKNALVGCRD
jgi:hypothetical protein